MRLTRKNKAGNYVFNFGITQDNKLLNNKLGQLEDIEDELGIDLITLFKALKEQQPIYYVNGSIIKFECFSNEYCYYYKDIDFKYKSLNIYKDICSLEESLYFKDYGKTWALTKEELLKEELE